MIPVPYRARTKETSTLRSRLSLVERYLRVKRKNKSHLTAAKVSNVDLALGNDLASPRLKSTKCRAFITWQVLNILNGLDKR